MVTTRPHSPQHWSGRKQQGIIAQSFPRVGVCPSIVCPHSSQSPAFTGFAGWELTLYKREGVWLYGLRGRVSGYWNPRQGVWLFGGRGRVSGYLELAPFTPLFQLGHCRQIQLMFIPEKGPFVNRKCWGAWGVRNLLCCWKEKQKTATWWPGPCGRPPTCSGDPVPATHRAGIHWVNVANRGQSSRQCHSEKENRALVSQVPLSAT